jgi:hypothetical protein
MFTTWLTEYFKPILETYLGEKTHFKILLLTKNAPGHPTALLEICDEITVVSIPANAATILQPFDI